jgi:molecular chaperone DnaK
MGRIIGIDLGTTDSVMAVVRQGKPQIIPNAEGERLTPSVVAYDPTTGQMLVGTPAKRQAITNLRNTIFSVKRFIGRAFDDPGVQRDIKLTPYKAKRAENGGMLLLVGSKWYSPVEISAVILKKLKVDVESYLGERVTQAVVTVPAYFNDCQRQATRDAAYLAGLDALRIINEPTAASLAYGLPGTEEKKVAVYHLGGGTLDVSILTIGSGVFEVIATNGDTHLGGDDFDQCVTDWICERFKQEHGLDPSLDAVALQRVREAAEKAKCELSTVSQTEIDLPCIIGHGSEYKHLRVTLTRAQLEQLVHDLLEQTLSPCEQAMHDAGMTCNDIDEVILAGRQTRMPGVRELVTRFFGKEPSVGIDPAEAAAMGAAIQGSVLDGTLSDVLLLDVTPLTLGLATLGGVATPLIERNTTIPTKKIQTFSTAADGQASVEIQVVQGERPMAADNIRLGRFVLDGIPPAPRGIPQVDVTFDIDADGILHVSARDKATGKERSVSIVAPTVAARGVKEAEMTPSYDAAWSMIRQAEASVSRHRDHAPATVVSLVQDAISALQTALKHDDAAKIWQQRETLDKLLEALETLAGSRAERAVELLVGLFLREPSGNARAGIRRALRDISTSPAGEALKSRSPMERLLGQKRWLDEYQKVLEEQEREGETP